MTYEEIARQKIGEAMKLAMNEREYSINALEKNSGVSKTIIYKIIRGENYEITSLIKIMRILKIHLEISLMGPDNNIHTMGGNKPSMN